MSKNQNILVLEDVNFVDVKRNELRIHMSIVLQDGIIFKIDKYGDLPIPNQAKVLKLTGKTVIPGLIDVHLHLLQSGVDDFLKPYAESVNKKLKRNLLLTLNSGVTTVRNMPGGKGYTVLKYRDNINKHKIKGPRIFTSGPALTAPFGYFSIKMFFPFHAVLRFILKKLFLVTSLSIDVDNEEQARKAVRKLHQKGVDFIKTITTGKFIPFIERDASLKEELLKRGLKEANIEASMKPEVLSAIISEAHRVGLKVAAHNVYFPENFKSAVKLGVNSIEHTPFGVIDDETFDMMKEKGTYWVPTGFCGYNYMNLMNHPHEYKDVMENVPEPFYSLGEKTLGKVREGIQKGDIFHSLIWEDIQKLNLEYFPYNFKNALSKGIKICAAVDAGASGSGYVPHGQLYKELDLFVRNGMSEIEAIKTATIHPAELLGLEDKIGSIEIGKYGDLVVLDGNPLDDILKLNEVLYVIKDGDIVFHRYPQHE